MSTSTITRDEDGDVTVIKADDAPPQIAGTAHVPVAVHAEHHHRGLDGGSFTAGLLLGVILLLLVQRAIGINARREARHRRDVASIGPAEDRMAAEVAALARRTATLETIVTDPAQRTAREIDALR